MLKKLAFGPVDGIQHRRNHKTKPVAGANQLKNRDVKNAQQGEKFHFQTFLADDTRLSACFCIISRPNWVAFNFCHWTLQSGRRQLDLCAPEDGAL